MSEEKQERLVIIAKGIGPRWEKEFFFKIQEAILGGYRIADTGLREDASLRNYKGNFGKAVLYLEGKEPIEEKPVVVVEEKVVEAPVETPIEKEEQPPTVTPPKEEVPTKSPLEVLEGLKKAAPLKEFAREQGIDIPEDTKKPLAIKKYLKEQLEAPSKD